MHEWITIILLLALAVLLVLWLVERMPCPPDSQQKEVLDDQNRSHNTSL